MNIHGLPSATSHTDRSDTVVKSSFLPIEILFSEEEVEFLPRWFLTLRLRVCKAWHAVVERHLYRCVSVVIAFPSAGLDVPVRRGCAV